MDRKIKKKICYAIWIIIIAIISILKLNIFWHDDSIILGYGLLIVTVISCVVYIWIIFSMDKRHR